MARQVQFQESDLDTITVGNFTPFQTGQLDWVQLDRTRMALPLLRRG